MSWVATCPSSENAERLITRICARTMSNWFGDLRGVYASFSGVTRESRETEAFVAGLSGS